MQHIQGWQFLISDLIFKQTGPQHRGIQETQTDRKSKQRADISSASLWIKVQRNHWKAHFGPWFALCWLEVTVSTNTLSFCWLFQNFVLTFLCFCQQQCPRYHHLQTFPVHNLWNLKDFWRWTRCCISVTFFINVQSLFVVHMFQ